MIGPMNRRGNGTTYIACSRNAFEPPQRSGQPKVLGERNDARRLARAVETARPLAPRIARGHSTQFRHDLSLMTPLGIERLLDDRDHPLCLSQGRSTRSCSGAPQKHPSPADARSKIEGVALPPIDAFTRRAERRGSTPSPGPAAPPNFFVLYQLTHTQSSWQGLALPSTSFVVQDWVVAGKLVDPKAKPWDDGVGWLMKALCPPVDGDSRPALSSAAS